MILRLVLILILSFIVGAGFAQTVSIPDPNLRLAIEAPLGKAPGAPISATEMESLIELSAPNANITDLTGLEAATSLQRLYLGEQYVAVEGRNINQQCYIGSLALIGLNRF